MSERLGEEELEEVANLISRIIIPKLVRIADTYNYDRNSLIKYVADLFSTMAEVATFENYNISPVSNSEKPNKWIPVSERLPKNSDYVLVTDGLDMFVAWHNPEKERFKGWHSFDELFDLQTPIVAWQPLPEPYKADMRGE